MKKGIVDRIRIAAGWIVWLAIAWHCGPLGICLGGIVALLIAPKGFYIR